MSSDQPGRTDGPTNYKPAGAARTFDNSLDLNLIGLRTLYLKEVRRFFKVFTQTILAPVVTTCVFLAIFALALGRSDRMIGELAFLTFLAPGLITMAIVQNAFANTSSSIGIAKVQGNIVDYLMPPLSPGELLFGVVMGGVTRGVVVGVAVLVTMLFVVDLSMPQPLIALYAVLMASFILAVLGFVTALWAEKFDQMAAITNFVITPLSFLSGTFYSIHDLPEPFHMIALFNPFFYMIDLTRYGMTGHADGVIWVGMAVLALVAAGLWLFAIRLVQLGYKLKA